ncbi:hypothetical protein ACFLZ8_00930 [Planctomycetota bacterium]
MNQNRRRTQCFKMEMIKAEGRIHAPTLCFAKRNSGVQLSAISNNIG